MIHMNSTPFVLWICVRVLVTHGKAWNTHTVYRISTPQTFHTKLLQLLILLSLLQTTEYDQHQSHRLADHWNICRKKIGPNQNCQYTPFPMPHCVKLPPVNANSNEISVPSTFPCLASLSLNNSDTGVFGQGQMTSYLWRYLRKVQSSARFSVLQEGREQLSSAQFTGRQERKGGILQPRKVGYRNERVKTVLNIAQTSVCAWSSFVRTEHTQICARIKDPISIYGKREGLTAGGIVTHKYCIQ